MNDDQNSPGEGGTRPPGGAVPPDTPAGAGGPPESPEDALRSLERLEALARGEEPRPAAAPAAPAAPAPSRRRARPRLTTAPRPAQTWARIAAPVAFLVAVIVVVSLLFQSFAGDGGQAEVKPTPKASKSAAKTAKPSAKASATKSAKPSASPSGSASATPSGGTKVYVVKGGDTLTAIAARFDTSVAKIEELNPDADLTTLQPGQKITVPVL